MLKKILYISLMCFCFSNISTLFAQNQRVYFPHEPNFTLGSQPNAWVKTGDATWTNQGLELTPNITSKFGAAALDLASFNAKYELIITFDYSMYKGSGGGNGKGDGFAFFLYDGDVPLSIGGYGRGLGYTAGELDNGLNGAYLGIGFDVYGNFRQNYSTKNIVGLESSTFSSSGSRNKNHITVRGGTQKINGVYNRKDYYPVLYTVTTDGSGSGTQNTLLNLGTGAISTSYLRGLEGSSTPNFDSFDLSTTSDSNFNKVELRLRPTNPVGNGMYITLKVTREATTYTILQDFYYQNNVKYRAINQQGSLDSSWWSPPQSVLKTLDATPPINLKLGFAGSTGDATQRHLIKNVKITLPNMHETFALQKETCFNMASQEFFAFENANFSYKSNSGSITTGRTLINHIDPLTFQFVSANDDILIDASTISTNTITYYQTNIGTWSYNKTSGNVSFNPINGFVGTAEIYYTVKGRGLNQSPFDEENYRTRPTKLSVKVNRCGIVVNPQLPNSGIIRSGK